jgi:hypothetical protein
MLLFLNQNITKVSKMSQQIPEITVRIGVYQEDGLKDVLPCYTMTKHCHSPGFEMELIFAVMRILKWNYTFVQADRIVLGFEHLREIFIIYTVCICVSLFALLSNFLFE